VRVSAAILGGRCSRDADQNNIRQRHGLTCLGYGIVTVNRNVRLASTYHMETYCAKVFLRTVGMSFDEKGSEKWNRVNIRRIS
jgi:hypothetical protein